MAKKVKRQAGKSKPSYTQRLSALRDQLDTFLNSFDGGDEALLASLNEHFGDLKPYDALPALIRSYLQSSEPLRERLDSLLPMWLTEGGKLASLQLLLEHQKLSGSLADIAMHWLRLAGVDNADLTTLTQWSSFYSAYKIGNEFQEAIMGFFYTDRRKHQVRGLNFLIDHNPPWEGAVKDVALTPSEPASAKAGEWFVELWSARDPTAEIRDYSAEQVKTRILTALQINLREDIRVPQDLIHARAFFLTHILSLPDRDDTPRFNAEDFDRLVQLRHSPEVLTRDEQRFGYRTRMGDGQEIRILREVDSDMLSLLDLPDDD